MVLRDAHLHTVPLVLKDPSERVVEVEGSRFGFREVEIRDAQLFVNGVSPRFVEIVTHVMLAPGDSDDYTVYGSGDVVVEKELPAREPEIPRFGMQMAVPGVYDTMTWYGRGPRETYEDRKTGAAVGRYSGRVDELVHDYVRPPGEAVRLTQCPQGRMYPVLDLVKQLHAEGRPTPRRRR